LRLVGNAAAIKIGATFTFLKRGHFWSQLGPTTDAWAYRLPEAVGGIFDGESPLKIRYAIFQSPSDLFSMTVYLPEAFTVALPSDKVWL
jgi:hypothetical protein